MEPGKKRGLTFSGLQLGKQLDLWEVVRVVITEVLDSDFEFSGSQVLRGELQAS